MEIKNETIYLYDDQIGRCDFVQSWGDDLMLVNSARASFGVEKEELDERDKKLINYLVEHKHTSTLEHCGITFRCVVPLFVRSQHHRHRTWSYNEISRRYTDVNLEFYEPESFRTQHKSNRQASNEDELINPDIGDAVKGNFVSFMAADVVKEHHRISLQLFDTLIEAGVCREQARGVLPQNLYTTYYATTNLNNLFKFIHLRDKPEAQWEIQVLAKAMLKFAEREFPYAAGALLRGHNG
jgi:thymidylate synthase (FAD)